MSRSQRRPIEFDVHLFSDVVYSQSGTPFSKNHVVWIAFPLKMTKLLIRRPLAEIDSIIDTYSRFSGRFM